MAENNGKNFRITFLNILQCGLSALFPACLLVLAFGFIIALPVFIILFAFWACTYASMFKEGDVDSNNGKDSAAVLKYTYLFLLICLLLYCVFADYPDSIFVLKYIYVPLLLLPICIRIILKNAKITMPKEEIIRRLVIIESHIFLIALTAASVYMPIYMFAHL